MRLRNWLISIGVILASVIVVIALPLQQKTTLTWVAPTTNMDGSPLTDLTGYKLYWGAVSGIYTGVKDVGNVTTVNIQIATASNLRGNYCFAVTAYDTALNESDYSNEVCAVFSKKSSPPKTLGIQ